LLINAPPMGFDVPPSLTRTACERAADTTAITIAKDCMNKFALTIVVLACAAFPADQHFNNGRYSYDMVQTLHRMKHAVGR
jgi:hypothetical protein